MIAHKHTLFLFQRVWGRFMAGQVLLAPVNFSPHSDQGQDEASVLESLWGSGVSPGTVSAQAAKKRKNFSELDPKAKRRVRRVLNEAYAGGASANDPLADGEGVLSVQVALARASPEFSDMEAKAAMFDTFAGSLREKGGSQEQRAVRRVLVDQLAAGTAAGLFSQHQVSRTTGVHRATLRKAERRQRVEVEESLRGRS
jgi:hypothetical protein